MDEPSICRSQVKVIEQTVDALLIVVRPGSTVTPEIDHYLRTGGAASRPEQGPSRIAAPLLWEYAGADRPRLADSGRDLLGGVNPGPSA